LVTRLFQFQQFAPFKQIDLLNKPMLKIATVIVVAKNIYRQNDDDFDLIACDVVVDLTK